MTNKEPPENKRYVIRKYIVASSAAEALKKEQNTPADECWVDERWLDQKIIRGFDQQK